MNITLKEASDFLRDKKAIDDHLAETEKPLYECVFSPDRVYRYTLIDSWDKTLPRIAFIGLNPSTADEEKLDPTLTRCRKRAEGWGYGSFVMLNLFAFRSPHPKVMQAHCDPVGPMNDLHIYWEVRRAKTIVAAWGAGGAYMGREASLKLRMTKTFGYTLHCLGITQEGFPIHPMARGKHRVSDDVQLIPFLGGESEVDASKELKE